MLELGFAGYEGTLWSVQVFVSCGLWLCGPLWLHVAAIPLMDRLVALLKMGPAVDQEAHQHQPLACRR